MAFELDLSLEDMLRLANYNSDKARDLGPLSWPNISQTRPYAFSYSFILRDSNDVASNTVRLMRYHQDFLRRYSPWGDKAFLVNHTGPFYLECLSNLLDHGGRGVQEEETKVKIFQPEDPIKVVISIYNSKAEAWDFTKIAESGRGGHLTFAQEFAKVSYQREGREFLALFNILTG